MLSSVNVQLVIDAKCFQIYKSQIFQSDHGMLRVWLYIFMTVQQFTFELNLLSKTVFQNTAWSIK